MLKTDVRGIFQAESKGGRIGTRERPTRNHQGESNGCKRSLIDDGRSWCKKCWYSLATRLPSRRVPLTNYGVSHTLRDSNARTLGNDQGAVHHRGMHVTLEVIAPGLRRSGERDARAGVGTGDDRGFRQCWRS